MSAKALGLVVLKSIWMDEVMRSILYTKHYIGNQPTVIGAEPILWFVFSPVGPTMSIQRDM